MNPTQHEYDAVISQLFITVLSSKYFRWLQARNKEYEYKPARHYEKCNNRKKYIQFMLSALSIITCIYNTCITYGERTRTS